MKERLRTSDYRFIAVCLLLFAGAAWYSVRNFYRAFPEASIDFRVGRDDAQALAGRFLAGQGFHVEGYRQASRFSYDDEAKTFLEREAGLEQANRIMGTRVRLWRWAYRWFRPQQKEEYGVEITPGTRFPRKPRVRLPPPNRRAPWPKISCGPACIAIRRRSNSWRNRTRRGRIAWIASSRGKSATSICTTPPTG